MEDDGVVVMEAGDTATAEFLDNFECGQAADAQEELCIYFRLNQHFPVMLYPQQALFIAKKLIEMAVTVDTGGDYEH